MKLVMSTYEKDADEILDILNETIENSTAIYDYKPRLPESMVRWFRMKEQGRFPVVGVESQEGKLLGFGSYGSFRAWPAYMYTVEHSVYVHRDYRGRGLGSQLVRALIERAKTQGVHVLVGGIDASNETSIGLHRMRGFVHAGTIRQAGFKFGRWLDLAFYQLTLETPSDPIDG